MNPAGADAVGKQEKKPEKIRIIKTPISYNNISYLNKPAPNTPRITTTTNTKKQTYPTSSNRSTTETSPGSLNTNKPLSIIYGKTPAATNTISTTGATTNRSASVHKQSENVQSSPLHRKAQGTKTDVQNSARNKSKPKVLDDEDISALLNQKKIGTTLGDFSAGYHEVPSWSFDRNSFLRRDGQFWKDPQTKTERILDMDGEPYGSEYIREQRLRKIKFYADLVYSFVSLVAGYMGAGTSADRFWITKAAGGSVGIDFLVANIATIREKAGLSSQLRERVEKERKVFFRDDVNDERYEKELATEKHKVTLDDDQSKALANILEQEDFRNSGDSGDFSDSGDNPTEIADEEITEQESDIKTTAAGALEPKVQSLHNIYDEDDQSDPYQDGDYVGDALYTQTTKQSEKKPSDIHVGDEDRPPKRPRIETTNMLDVKAGSDVLDPSGLISTIRTHKKADITPGSVQKSINPNAKYIRNIDDGRAMLLRMTLRGLVNESTLRAWDIIYNMGGEYYEKGNREKNTASIEQLFKITDPQSLQRLVTAEWEIQKLLSKSENTPEWKNSPENSGLIFVTDDFKAGLSQARRTVWEKSGKLDVPVIDLITHELVRDTFAHLVALYIQYNTSLVRGSRLKTTDEINNFKKLLYYTEIRFRKLAYNAEGFLCFSDVYSQQKNLLRKTREQKRINFTERTGLYYTDVYKNEYDRRQVGAEIPNALVHQSSANLGNDYDSYYGDDTNNVSHIHPRFVNKKIGTGVNSRTPPHTLERSNNIECDFNMETPYSGLPTAFGFKLK